MVSKQRFITVETYIPKPYSRVAEVLQHPDSPLKFEHGNPFNNRSAIQDQYYKSKTADLEFILGKKICQDQMLSFLSSTNPLRDMAPCSLDVYLQYPWKPKMPFVKEVLEYLMRRKVPFYVMVEMEPGNKQLAMFFADDSRIIKPYHVAQANLLLPGKK